MKYIQIPTPLILLIMLTSCKKFVVIPPPETQLETATVFNDEQSAIAAVVGLYSQMMQTSITLTNGAATVYPALSADELVNNTANIDYDAFRVNEISPTSSAILTRLWNAGYKNIYHANAVIEGLTKSTSLSRELIDQLKGEMLVVRSLNYFYLAGLFGDVPLVLGTDFQENSVMERSSRKTVFQQIVADLESSKTLLDESYPSAGRLRPNIYAARALLARTYLYQENWNAAEAEASSIINSHLYALVPSPANVFLAASPEAIWQMSPVLSTINASEGNLFNPFSATSVPTFSASSSLLTAFEPGDLRKTAWLKTTTLNNNTYAYPNKYKVRTGAPPYKEHYMVFRLAEIYLIRAEARVKLGNTSGALSDLNAVRSRAGLPNLAASTTSGEVLNNLMRERRLELMFEWGHRWLDLQRTGTADSILSAAKPGTWQPTDVLYPLPQSELETNPFLHQNPGY
ncbi:MAG: RagB/SusD family nutrient uptake outer membrane protein [Flavisolibacter sp.]